MKIDKANFEDNKDLILKKCISILKNELEIKRITFDLPFETIASHGASENTMVNTPNNILTENPEIYDYLGLRLEAYNKDFLSSFDVYISDCTYEINRGYRYGVTPLQAIEQGKNFIFLTHPNHWLLTRFQQLKKMVKCILYGEININECFKRI